MRSPSLPESTPGQSTGWTRLPRPARRRGVLLVLPLLLGLLLAGGAALALLRGADSLLAVPEPAAGHGAGDRRVDAGQPPTPAEPTPTVEPTGPTPTAEPTGYPAAGTGTFVDAPGGSPVAGTDGRLWRYRVAVEAGTDQDPVEFAAAVDAVLADPRSWIGSGELRVQRVADAELADFTIYLATPVTSERMCAEGGLDTAGYTSCRLPGQVIINLARWLTGVPDYGAPLSVYRTYVINHEVGHEFGEGHEACPAPGQPAPVMQQQTYGLQGCVANPWPWRDGRRYAGEIIP